MWSLIGRRLSAQRRNPADRDAAALGLAKEKVLIVLGKDDQIIIREEIMEDAGETIGTGNIKFVIVDAAHELPITKAKEVAESIWSFWT